MSSRSCCCTWLLQLCLTLFVLHRSLATPVLSPPTILYGGQCAANVSASSADLSSLLREKVIPSLNCPLLGSCKSKPGTSCKHIAEENPNAQSGDYWVRLCDGSVVQVYCDMNSRCCNSTRGWMRAAYIPQHHRPDNAGVSGGDVYGYERREASLSKEARHYWLQVHLLPSSLPAVHSSLR